MSVVTRFAPSPTGFLHIGGARTALFNWLYARHHGGQFRLRIEDTDRKRSTPEAIEAILDGLQWLGLEWDDEVVYQSARAERHAELARSLLESGHAYHCYASQEELEQMRQLARTEGRPMRYDGRWRDRDPAEAPEGVDPVVRLKAPTEGETVIEDEVQGSVRVANDQLDDMVLLRADGSPTYMLSVVVDDHDMGITHVIRGDDHLTNAFRQTQLYRALGWEVPRFAHIPLIHGPDGAKLSKRHGALGVETYRDMGYLPEALRNYLLRLGWGHGDEEIISTEQAIAWFDLPAVGRSASRFDFQKLEHLNAHYLREAEDARLVDLIVERFEEEVGETERQRLLAGMAGLKPRARTLVELAELAHFYVAQRPLTYNAKAEKLLGAERAPELLSALRDHLAGLPDWSEAAIEQAVRAQAEAQAVKLGAVAQPLRAALAGSNVSPGIFEVAAVLGREEALGRIDDAITATRQSGSTAD
ncbi:glutamate--tRNA ligase [Aquibaculum arenosum]|uniref:Glutamate--tRNA ligase n=1 Tax=Aquibaculum arenosum TaxID=3032591 RepID=A0ABT5YII7_9PROT|nr:glutamate--tRNA ligase [Fodinicurvata sp. CAU 1616]MDF2094759.1 glutamate--tRNA ligase [Fodinicurvata sp. CAU 1616]